MLEGLRLLRRREWYAAHDAIEQAWTEAEGDERAFLQGLIHVAVSLVHLEHGNARGARSQWHKASAKLDRLRAHPYDLDVPGWLAAVATFFAAIDLDERAARQTDGLATTPLPDTATWPVPTPVSGRG